MSMLRRAPRPLTGWLYLACGIGSLVVITLLVAPLIRALNRWADGETVDMMGFAAVGGVAFPFIIQLIAQGAQWMSQRHTERMAEYERGSAPSPFALPPSLPPPSQPSPTGGLVNNEAINQ